MLSISIQFYNKEAGGTGEWHFEVRACLYRRKNRMIFASLTNDYVFKEVISEERVTKQFISDVLKISMEDIREVRLVNPFLRKNREKQKQGILDIALLLNDATKMDIELQMRPQKYWAGRSLFYLAQMFTEDLRKGYEYDKLRKCISISILDFDLVKSDENHTVYKFCNEKGIIFSDLLELHVIELRKKLRNDAVDDWIRLFNAKSIEDLNMIKTQNLGIQRAMEMMREMSLSERIRAIHRDNLKRKRDRWAEDQYVFDQGMEQGIERGKLSAKTDWLLQTLESKGRVPTEVVRKIKDMTDEAQLDQLFLEAVNAESVETFLKKYQQIRKEID